MIFEHKGYTLWQEEEENHHYMIFDENDNFCMHAAYEGELFTEQEAKEIIEQYFNLTASLFEE